MPTSGIFFLPAPATVSDTYLPSQAIFNALAADHQLEPLPPWTLEHRLYRETSLGINRIQSGSGDSTGYLQVLTASIYGGNSYVSISRSTISGDHSLPLQATILAIPTGHGVDEFNSMITSRFTPLWQRRHLTQLSNGQAYDLGSFTVRFGELREIRSGQGGAQSVRGTLVEISTDDDFEGSASEAIRQFWSELNMPDAKEFMQDTSTNDEFGSLRKWFEALRIRT